MVGLFSRFSTRAGHRRAQSALEGREALPLNSEATGPAALATTVCHGVEVAVEFKPVEHPIEPLDNDRPIHCPLPEPSIVNDGRIWKARVSANAQRRADLPPMGEGGPDESEATPATQRTITTKRMILPSVSAPEHHLLKLLEESGI